MKNSIRNILWVRTDSIGDAVLSSSMLPYVHQAFAPAKITVLCQAHIAPIYEACPFVDGIITVPSEHKWQSQAQYEAVIKNIQELHPDILLNSTFATHGLADIPGLEFIPKRVAFRNVRDASYTDIISTQTQQKPELERHRDFLAGLGLNVTSLKPQVWITNDDDNFAKEVCTKHGLAPDRTIALFAGTRTDHRRYEHYGEALNRICKQNSYSVIALGNDTDYSINQQNLEATDVRAVNLSGTTTLRQTAAILKRCRLAVGAETAIAHIACAVGTPNVILLGGGHFGRFMPYSPLTSAVCLPLECFGCDWQCRYDKIRCVTDVSVEVLAEAVSRTITASSQKPRVFAHGPSLLNPKSGEQPWKRFDQLIDIESIEIVPLENKTPPVEHVSSPQPQIDVSIILCTKDRAALLDKMLASLKQATEGVTWEMIVVEGGSSDNTLDVLRAHGVRNVYDETQCLGPGRHTWPQLYNFGFSKARGKWTMYASDDILFNVGCITRAVKMLNEQKDEVAGGIFFYKNTHTGPDWDKLGIDFTFGPKLLMNYGLVKLTDFQAAGGLDEAYRFYCADGDLCFKLYEAGKELIPLPGCFVVHDNILDVAKQANADNSEADIQLYMQRWQHFVTLERPNPRRLLWHQDLAESFNLPASLPKIDSAIEHFWYGLACFQNSMFVQAKIKFLQAVQSACDPWLILWHLAKAAFESEDETLATKAAHAVLQLVPDFQQAKDLLSKLGSDSLENNCYSNHLAVSSKVVPNFTVMQNLPTQKTYPDNDLKAVPQAPAPLAVTPQTDVLAQLISAGLWSQGRPLRLHLGCGKWHFDGYINIDYPPENHNVVTNLGADLYADITKLNLPPQTVDEIRLHHVFEHFDRATALGLLIKWHEWLKVGGTLCMETPDLIGSAKTLLSDASLKTKMRVVRHLAGDQADNWAFHTDHWFAERFEKTLSQLGFGNIQTQTTSWQKEPNLSNVQARAAKQLHLAREKLLAACDELLLDSLVDDTPNELAKHKIWMHQIRTFLDQTASSSSKAEHPVPEPCAPNEEPSLQNDVEKEIVGLIFSKNRPMQLAAAIESFALHCLDNANIKLHVLYKATNELYRTQYNTLKNEFTDVTFIEETNFRAQTLAVISGYEHVLFLVDDNLFVTDFSLTDILTLLKQNHNALAFSLRLGKNTTYSYARDTQVPLPPFWYIGKKVLKYDWARSQFHFAYPLEVSSSIYRTADIVPLLEKLDFDNPNMLEGLMAANAQVYAKPRAALLCFEQSVTFCNPVNIVQTISNNRAGSLSRYSADSLAEMFEQGLRIDVQRYAGFVPNSPHQEVELEFVKSGGDSRTDEPMVSVEMIAYNAEKFIAAAIDSVLAQTYKNFELLIIDDGSDDRTKEIINSYSDPKIRYIHKPHKNRWSGTNVAIAQAKGQYIITVDSDDFIAADYIEKMVAVAQSHPEIDYFYPACLTIVDELGNPTGKRWDYIDFSDNTILPNFLFENAFSPIPHPGGMKRKALYQRLAGYEEVQNAADFVFLCRNSLKVRFMRVGDHSTYFYRLLPTSLSHKFKARNKITADILNEMVSIYPPEVLCPHIGRITEPALKRQQYYKYLMETFYKHVHGHMVKFGEYFGRYGDYYKQQLLNCAPAVNTAASAVAASTKSQDIQILFKRGIEQLKADQPALALDCFDEIYHSGGGVADLQYARAVAFARLGRIDETRKACLAQLALQIDHKPANELLEQISQHMKVTN